VEGQQVADFTAEAAGHACRLYPQSASASACINSNKYDHPFLHEWTRPDMNRLLYGKHKDELQDTCYDNMSGALEPFGVCINSNKYDHPFLHEWTGWHQSSRPDQDVHKSPWHEEKRSSLMTQQFIVPPKKGLGLKVHKGQIIKVVRPFVSCKAIYWMYIPLLTAAI
jgi:uncharacterized protein YcgI (DUF1989 family)